MLAGALVSLCTVTSIPNALLSPSMLLDIEVSTRTTCRSNVQCPKTSTTNYDLQHPTPKDGPVRVMGPEVFWMSHWNDWVQLYFWMVVIRGNGKTAIINTGPPDDLTALNERWSGGFGERGKLAREESRTSAQRAGVDRDQA